ncbi:MAG TPA: OsmC family protein [Vicinamibacterales bacterium]|nr:OsmC family protein [Vicinamibacterales bacterium]
MPTHRFEGTLTWRAGAAPPATGNHRVVFAGRPALEVSAAPQYRGDGTKLNPEELLVASLASCQLLTYLTLAARAGVEVRAYDDRPVGTLAMAEKKMRITEILLRPRITIGPASDADAARTLVERAHESCFIGASLACAVRLEPEIVRSEP